MSIYKVRIKCELVTPAFIYGSDGETPEMKETSIKGVLRFWWRAANAHLGLEKMKQKEAEIFGGINKDEKNNKIGKSKVSIRIVDKEINQKAEEEKLQYLKYLLYSVIVIKPAKRYIPSGSSFTIELRTTEKSYFDEYMKALLFLQYFGGIGRRSRRGAGGIRVVEIKGDYENNEIKELFKISLQENLDTQYAKIANFISSTNQKSYSVLKGSKVYILDAVTSWNKALEVIEDKYKSFRREKGNKIYSRGEFGLPAIENKVHIIVVKMGDNGNIEKVERRASPIIFKVIKVEDNKFYPVIIHMSGEFINGDYKMISKQKSNNLNKEEFRKFPKHEKEIINRFIQNIKKEIDGIKELTI